MSEEGLQEQRPLTMVAHANALEFIRPGKDSALIVVDDMIEKKNVTGLLLWAVWCQLRDAHRELKGINTSLATLADSAGDPKVLERRLQAQADTAISTILATLKGAGLPMPPGVDQLVQSARHGSG